VIILRISSQLSAESEDEMSDRCYVVYYREQAEKKIKGNREQAEKVGEK